MFFVVLIGIAFRLVVCVSVWCGVYCLRVCLGEGAWFCVIWVCYGWEFVTYFIVFFCNIASLLLRLSELLVVVLF